MQKFNKTKILKTQLLHCASQITNPQYLEMAYGFCCHLAELEEQENNSQAQKSRTNYKNGIIETLAYISNDDSVFLRQILIILLRHVEKKGGAAI